jgi:putative PEP-CTERM system histidine kinase
MRRKLRVFVHKHFYKQKYDYRGEWLKFTKRLATCKTLAHVHEAILNTYQETFGLRGLALYTLEAGRGNYILSAHFLLPQAPNYLKVSGGLLLYFLDRERVLDPSDGEYLPTAEESSLFRKLGNGLIVPLIGNGQVEGLVVFGEQLTKEEFIYEDYDLMKTFARQAASAIRNIRLSEELIESKEITALAKISSFIIHDIKNLSYSLSLSLDNAEDYISNPEFQSDMINTIRNTVLNMKDLIQKLNSIPEKQTLNTELADVHPLVKSTIEEINNLNHRAHIIYSGCSAMSIIDLEEIKKVVLNLILNSIDASEEGATVIVETAVDKDNITISVKDGGCGMTEDFIKNHLFKPFRTSKKKGLGIGLYQCKQIIDSHRGRILAESKPGKGTVFTVYLPKAEDTYHIAYKLGYRSKCVPSKK